eukprot:scaffold94162_cov32-Phaeocystis_antarctica.AAC.2
MAKAKGKVQGTAVQRRARSFEACPTRYVPTRVKRENVETRVSSPPRAGPRPLSRHKPAGC